MAKVSNFTPSDCKKIENCKTVEEARDSFKAIVNRALTSKRPMKPEKVKYLKVQVDKCETVMDVTRMMYNMLLAGEGLRSIQSNYSNRF